MVVEFKFCRRADAALSVESAERALASGESRRRLELSEEIGVLEEQVRKLEGGAERLDRERGLTEEEWKRRRNVKVKELVTAQRRLGGRCYLREKPGWCEDVSNCIGFGFVAWMRACGHRLGADGRALKGGRIWLEINVEGRLWKKSKSMTTGLFQLDC